METVFTSGETDAPEKEYWILQEENANRQKATGNSLYKKNIFILQAH